MVQALRLDLQAPAPQSVLEQSMPVGPLLPVRQVLAPEEPGRVEAEPLQAQAGQAQQDSVGPLTE